MPGKHFDVATFEVKAFDAIDVAAVYEALAHRRAATRSYVIFHVPENRRDDQSIKEALEQICDEAERHGVGVIVASHPDEYDTWDFRVEASRTEPSPERLNEFIAVQLTDGAKEEITQWFR